MENKAQPVTILASLERQLDNQLKWFQAIAQQLTILETITDTIQEAIGLELGKTGESEKLQAITKPATIDDHIKFIVENFEIISTHITNKLAILIDDVESIKHKLGYENPVKEQEK